MAPVERLGSSIQRSRQRQRKKALTLLGGLAVVSKDLYKLLTSKSVDRRTALKGAAGATAGLAIAASPPGKSIQSAAAQDDLRAQILQIPGVGKGSPTEADMQKVGEMCLGPTKTNVTQDEFKGVELNFLGLNNQGLHNFVFRALLKSWEDYTGAKINWIDLSQADYNGRLQQSIATGTVDFDIAEMGAPYEGDVCGKGLTSAMPDWVSAQIDMTDYVGYLQPPVGTWDNVTYRVSIDGDCHNFNYRTDYFADEDLKKAWTDAATRTNSPCRRPGSKSKRSASSSRVRRSAARMPTATSTSASLPEGSAGTSSRAAPLRTRSTQTTKRGCSTPTR